jgi:hypothetical protein
MNSTKQSAYPGYDIFWWPSRGYTLKLRRHRRSLEAKMDDGTWRPFWWWIARERSNKLLPIMSAKSTTYAGSTVWSQYSPGPRGFDGEPFPRNTASNSIASESNSVATLEVPALLSDQHGISSPPPPSDAGSVHLSMRPQIASTPHFVPFDLSRPTLGPQQRPCKSTIALGPSANGSPL